MLIMPELGDLPFARTTLEEYLEACTRCEITVVVREWASLVLLRAALAVSGRERSGRGRFLKRNLPTLGLNAGDRLEPSSGCYDYGMIYEMTAIPDAGLTLTFWRPSAETRTKHRNPLISRALGIEPCTWLGDVLHCLYLGVFQVYAAAAFEALTLANAFRGPASYSGLTLIEYTLGQFKAALFQWYGVWRRTHRDRDITSVEDITMKMVRTKSGKAAMKLKAAETKGVCMFLGDLLPAMEARLGIMGPVWSRIARAVRQHMNIMDEHPWVLPEGAVTVPCPPPARSVFGLLQFSDLHNMI